jgi:hypothetical protein
MALSIIGIALVAVTSACASEDGRADGRDQTAGSAASGVVVQASAESASVAERGSSNPRRPELSAAERRFYRDMAKAAFMYLDANYQSTTGFVNATPEWANTTLWDVGGQLLAFHAAKELGLLPAAEYQRRTTRALATLEKVPLFRGAAFNKVYSTKTVAIGEGTNGWSATDLGRLLVALKIIATREPQFAVQIARVVTRNDFKQIVKDGYLHGQLIGTSGKPWTFQEGRIGYEQYAAAGFNLWGADVGNALDLERNSVPVTVLGIPLRGDKRFEDRLLSEPFILQGLELGLTGAYGELAANVLRAQEARFVSTGQVTIASEDAVAVAPEYFFYYCVYCNGKPFIIDLATPGKNRDTPRWVSTKAAFGWHALLPSDYTKKATDYVTPALDSKRGWASGVYEKTRASTTSFDINTAAVLLEVAYYQLRGGKPLIETATLLPE